MGSPIVEDEIIKQVIEWDKAIHKQKERVQRYPSDIAMVVKKTQGNELIGAFPIFYSDKIEDVMDKYVKVFSEEALQFMNQIEAERQVLANENGMSREKTMQMVAQFPEKLYNILKFLGEKVHKYDFFSPEGYKKLKEIMPRFFFGNMRSK